MTTEQQAEPPAAHPTNPPAAEPRAAESAQPQDVHTAPPAAEPHVRGRAGADPQTAALVDVLIRALRALGDAGRADYANRLAGQAWAAVRADRPRAADRINGLMHYLARLPADQAPVPDPTSQEKS